MSLRLTILGCHSATPRSHGHTSSQYLEVNNEGFLIDCGEGSQAQLRKYKIKFSRIKRIFISHLHGDHFFGLIGLIATFGLLNRKSELHIHGPKGIKKIILMQLKLSGSWVAYPLHFHELEAMVSELIFENEKVEVHTIPLSHRIYTNGFLFKEKPLPRNLTMTTISKYPEIEICDYQNLKKGRDYKMEDGSIIPNEELTFDPPKILQYAYCSDTAYDEKIIPLIKDIDLLYHESTFLEDNKELAQITKHATALEAATIAKKANVKQLILGHYSSRYKDTTFFQEEAKIKFSNTVLAEAGKEFILNNQN
jgi:ribonuclease Z